MAAPNIVNVTTIVPHTVTLTPANTARQGLVAAPSTGATHKINTIIVANLDASVAYDCTVELRLADGTTYRSIANTISVPADATLIVLDKTTALYLKEDESIGATAGTASDLVVTCSWEEINS